VYQKDDQTDDRDQILHQKRYLRKFIQKFDHQGIQLFAAVMDYFEREIGIEYTQDQYGKDQGQVFGIVAVDIIVLVFLFSARMFSMPLEYVFAEGASGKFPSVRLIPSILLHKSLRFCQMLFSTILFKL
jgi:hypothetical protein